MLEDRNRRKVESGKWRAEGRRTAGYAAGMPAAHGVVNLNHAQFPQHIAWLAVLALLAFASVGLAAGKPLTTTASQPSIRATGKADLYDVDASATDVKLVLEMLARRSGANIVVSPEVTGDINAHLKRVSVDAILDFLSTAQGFKWEKSGDTYLVASKEKLAKPPAVQPPAPPAPPPEVLIWECKHIRPSDAIATITKLFASITAAEAPNSVTPTLLADQSTKEGAASASTVTSTTGKANSTRIVLMGAVADLEKANEILDKLDVARRQVSMQVAITEISSSGSKDLGINWSWTDVNLTENNLSGIGFGKFTKENMTISAAISALVKDGKAKLLAQPNISVLDSESAEILIGDRILFPKLVGYNQVGAPIYDKDEERVGIELKIAPKIAGDDEIIMTLHPQVSLVTGYLKTQAGDYPQISTREARTTVSVKNGATLAIGGLLRDNDITSASRFPVLSSIPLIGHLFRQHSRTTERTEIVILVTPRIVQETPPVAH